MSEEHGREHFAPRPGRLPPATEVLRERLAAWLEETLAEEPPPPGVAEAVWDALDMERRAGSGDPQPSAAGAPDLYQLFTALTALTQEIKLQGRAFGRLADRLATTPSPEREDVLRREGEDQTWREVLDSLLEVRDSLLRGHQACTRHRSGRGDPGVGEPTPPRGAAARLAGVLAAILRRPDAPASSPWGRLVSASATRSTRASPDGDPGARHALEAVHALEEGLELSLRRLDALLESRGVRPIECLDRPFDPHRMVAVDVEDTETGPEGLVLEVYREGYERNGAILRPSRVKVARRRTSAPAEGHNTRDDAGQTTPRRHS